VLSKWKRNLEMAFDWCQKVAENGNVRAQNNLGILYEKVRKNLEKAFYWYQKAVKNGNDYA